MYTTSRGNPLLEPCLTMVYIKDINLTTSTLDLIVSPSFTHLFLEGGNKVQQFFFVKSSDCNFSNSFYMNELSTREQLHISE